MKNSLGLILCFIIVCKNLYILESVTLGVSGLIIDKTKYTGYGTYIANMTANSKLPKYAKVDIKMKQRVLAHFFQVEGVNKSEITRRLKLRFHEQTIDLNEKETLRELEKRRNLHYNVVERIIIQFLDAEKVRPAEIFKRLRKVSDHGQHWCNVYRWVYKFRKGRTDVANIPCLKTMKPISKLSRKSANLTNKLTQSKCAKISPRVKYCVLIEFLRSQNISECETEERLTKYFGNKTLESVKESYLSDRHFVCNVHPSVRERIIIQLLNLEGMRPSDIFRRLRKSGMMKGRNKCYVYRWVVRFKEGRSDVENKHWTMLRKNK